MESQDHLAASAAARRAEFKKDDFGGVDGRRDQRQEKQKKASDEARQKKRAQQGQNNNNNDGDRKEDHKEPKPRSAAAKFKAEFPHGSLIEEIDVVTMQPKRCYYTVDCVGDDVYIRRQEPQRLDDEHVNPFAGVNERLYDVKVKPKFCKMYRFRLVGADETRVKKPISEFEKEYRKNKQQVRDRFGEIKTGDVLVRDTGSFFDNIKFRRVIVKDQSGSFHLYTADLAAQPSAEDPTIVTPGVEQTSSSSWFHKGHWADWQVYDPTKTYKTRPAPAFVDITVDSAMADADKCDIKVDPQAAMYGPESVSWYKTMMLWSKDNVKDDPTRPDLPVKPRNVFVDKLLRFIRDVECTIGVPNGVPHLLAHLHTSAFGTK